MADLFLAEMCRPGTAMDGIHDPRAGSMMRQVVAVIPVKDLTEAKSRLSGVLSPGQRRMLVLGCLRRELAVLSRVAEIDEVIVVTPDPEVRQVAEEMGARVLAEPGTFGHNAALDFAARELAASAGRDMVVLPADLPLLSHSAVQKLLALRPQGEPVITIAPDRLRSGTNALVCPLPAILPFSFGPDSFHRHVQAARERGLHVRMLELENLGLDIDTPEDIAILRIIDPSLSEWLLGRPEGRGQVQARQLSGPRE